MTTSLYIAQHATIQFVDGFFDLVFDKFTPIFSPILTAIFTPIFTVFTVLQVADMRRAMEDLRHQGRQRVVSLISEVRSTLSHCLHS